MTLDSPGLVPGGNGDGSTLDSAVFGIGIHAPMARPLIHAGICVGGGGAGGTVEGCGVGVGVGEGEGDDEGAGEGDDEGAGEGDDAEGELFPVDSSPPPPQAHIAKASSDASEKFLWAVVRTMIGGDGSALVVGA